MKYACFDKSFNIRKTKGFILFLSFLSYLVTFPQFILKIIELVYLKQYDIQNSELKNKLIENQLHSSPYATLRSMNYETNIRENYVLETYKSISLSL